MVTWLIDSAVRMRRLVVAAVVAVLALGVVQLDDAPLDVYPEFKPSAVQIQTEALGLSAEEVEELITAPLEQDLLNGIPWLETIQSQSMPGLSAIDLTFEEGTNLWLARQMVQERMAQAHALPNVGTPPTMVQPTSATSRVAMVAMRSDEVSMIDMSVLARWQMRPRLMAIPGVAQVSIWGQRERQLQVHVDPERLQQNDVTLTQLIKTTGNALWVSPLSFVEASTPGTGGFVETPNQRIGVQHVSPITTSEQLAAVAIEGVQGQPKRLGDVAEVIEDHQPLIGDAAQEGDRSLMLVVERFPDADVAQVTADVEAALQAMSAGLSGITLDTDVYRPAGYVDSATDRLGIAALVGLVLMLAAVGLLTWSWRTALITFGAVATSLVTALYVLRLAEQPLTTMTLLGLAAVTVLVVDDVVGDAGAFRVRAREHQDAGRSTVIAWISAAVTGRRSPLVYATVITAVALVPLLFVRDPAGAFVRPALLVFGLAALASFLVALVVTPVLAVLLTTEEAAVPHRTRFDRLVHRGYDRTAGRTVGRAVPAVLGVGVLAVLLAAGLPALGSGSLLPTLEDRNVLVRLEAAPGTSLAEMDRVTGLAAAEVGDLAGVESVGMHVGRAVGADEIVDVDAGEIWVKLAEGADYDATFAAVRDTVRAYPGLRSEVRTYADDRVAAVSASTGDSLVVRVSGTEYDTLQQTAEMVAVAMKTVEGVILPEVEPLVRQPTVSVQVDLAAAQQQGLRPGDVRREVSTLISGLTVGSLYEQQAIFDVVVWGGPQTRSDIQTLAGLTVHAPDGRPVRLGDVATVDVTPSPTVITHDGVHRSLDVIAEVRGRDAGEVAADATEKLRQMTFPFEYRAEVLGDAADRAAAQRNVLLAVGAAAVLVYLLMQAATNSWKGAAALLVAAPLAGSGALLAGHLVGGAWSAGVLAALAAVVALAIRQSLVLVRRAQVLHADGRSPAAALTAAGREQAPAVVVAVLVTAALFLPAAVIGGAGLELVQPFAVALFAGLLTSTVVVLFLVPSLFSAVGGLRPAPVTGPDTPDGEPVAAVPAPGADGNHGRHARPDTNDAKVGEGSAMRTTRSFGIASLCVAAGLGLAGCQASASATDAEEAIAAAATVEEAADGGPARLHLTEESVLRLGLQTAPVSDAGGQLTVPYAAVVYDADGSTWAFVEQEPGVYQREAIAIASVEGDTVRLSEGPAAGTPVVTVAAAELVGVEAGISGGE
ncbi:efflux RND transporter permease subunit [Geodermatophilus sp. YIM 151500]|uniref:efflux RND transporter permease subunit n=1 Tax=Geodermatophilus sp. YIM 151500 TaxID=2984531 RepID=UPI0021E4D3B4|nr:efflux RND transporter permease subunit [Geodermatophilus sp. YIM 151500]MCV2487984.1 efflux RND transporter permease subunit [Geodermatophilus sp. YIM 151500]